MTWAENFDCELDWPFCSWGTGHYQKPDQCQAQLAHAVPLDSFYLKLWRRNKCNFRNFQNIAVDGADSGAMSSKIVKTMSGSVRNNVPSIVLFALVANDVCTPHPGTSHMTPPDKWFANNLETLRWLDDHVAPGSHVLFVGMMHGGMFWEHASSPYPYFDLTYADVWAKLSDHEEGCPGGMFLCCCFRTTLTVLRFFLGGSKHRLQDAEPVLGMDESQCDLEGRRHNVG
jgi:acyloxyacyl hydrolase